MRICRLVCVSLDRLVEEILALGNVYSSYLKLLSSS